MSERNGYWLTLSVFVIVGYVVVGFWTFGWRYNHTPTERYCSRAVPTDCWEVSFNKTDMSVVWGVLWPVYWSGKLAIEGTK